VIYRAAQDRADRAQDALAAIAESVGVVLYQDLAESLPLVGADETRLDHLPAPVPIPLSGRVYLRL
jgi:prophage tail gpP-like protein